jgi:predicted GNAT family N-acyltransferase
MMPDNMPAPVIIIRSDVIAPSELHALFNYAPWASSRDETGLAQMMRASLVYVAARREGTLVGFGRAWGDGIYRAVIDDVVVSPNERGNGLGARIIEALLSECADIDEVALTCRNEVASFYEKFGFVRYSGAHMKLTRR